MVVKGVGYNGTLFELSEMTTEIEIEKAAKIHKINVIQGTEDGYINEIETNDRTLKNTFFDGATIEILSKSNKLDVYESVLVGSSPLQINESYKQTITISDGIQPNYTTLYLKVVLNNPTPNTKIFIRISQTN